MPGLYPRLGVSNPFDTQLKLVTSPFFSPSVLAIIRLVLATYAIFEVLFTLIWEAVITHDASSYFSYFTDLSYIGVTAYFWAAGVQTLVFARAKDDVYPLQKWPRFLQFLHSLLFTTIVTYPIIVTVVFWILLASPTTFATKYSSWANISHHALNTVFILFEIFFTSMPPMPWLHLPIAFVTLALYLGVAYITHATQGFYTYSFLDPKKEKGFLAVYIIGIAVAEVVVFFLVRYIIVLRQWLTRKRTGAAGAGEAQEASEAIDDWEEVQRPKTPASGSAEGEEQLNPAAASSSSV